MRCQPTLELVERISDGDDTLAIIVRADYAPSETSFITPPECKQQLGFVVRAAGTEIPRHRHLPFERRIRGTTECLVVRRGRAELTLYNDRCEAVYRGELNAGDVVLLVSGGHGFRAIEDTVFLEVKQGPYPGIEEKERF